MPNETTQVDPLRVRSWKPAFKDDDALRGRLVSLIVDSIADMSNMRLQEIAQFIDIVENDHGCTTPAEEFITDLVSDHYRNAGEGLTPEDVEWRLETFRTNFADAVEVAKRFNRTYISILNPSKEQTDSEG